MKASTCPMQTDLFNTIASQTVLPAASRAEAVQLLASLLYEVEQTQGYQRVNREAGDEQDQR